MQKEAALEKNGAAADEGGKGAKAVPELPASEALLENADLADAERAIVDRPLVGAVIAPETLWACTTCGACMEACPAFVEHVPKVVKMRTYQVSMESAFPPEAQATFRNMENNGNPWGLGWQTRAKWAEGLDVPTIAEAPDAEYLYWPGCSGAFDARNRKVSAALVSLLAEAGVSFAILGNEEKCCGDAARRMGNEFVYFMLASENIATLQAYGVKKIIVQCPHCYQALARDYPQLGGHFEVIHHSELLARLVREGRLPPRERGARARVLPRLVLSGPLIRTSMRHRARWSVPPAEAWRRWSAPQDELLLRSRRRSHVARGERRCAHQRGALRPALDTDPISWRLRARSV